MNSYLLIKSLHLIAVVSWMAGLLYLPRIFVYHVENIKKKEAKAIISLLIDATGLCSKNPLGSMEIVEKALLKVSNTFNEGTPEYRTLRAKVLIKKATLLDPIERTPLIEEANSLDPTREKFYLSF